MHIVQKVNLDELAAKLSELEGVETIDLGAVQLHLGVEAGNKLVLVENSINESDSAMIKWQE